MPVHLHILISAGPTQEPIDPVRFLSNRSSGRMGYALVRAALAAKHRVTLVTGPVAIKPPEGCRVIGVKTAREMRRALLRHFPTADVVFQVAAVADYRPVVNFRKKIKKITRTLTLKLRRNPDILAEMARKKRRGQILVGFAAETHAALSYAREKLVRKRLDFIVVNDVSNKAIGFESHDNAVVVIARDGRQVRFPRQPKTLLAQRILEVVLL